MSRRKQSRPLKRLLDDEEETLPTSEAKCVKMDVPSTSATNKCHKTAGDVYSVPPISSASTKPTPLSPAKPSTANPLLLLEDSVKKLHSSHPVSHNQASKPSGGLGALYNFVGKLTTSPALGQQQEDGVSSILKCLQCGKGFPAMDQLVRHMQETRHFKNIPKSYSNLVQLERQKVLNMKLQSKSDALQLACLKCGEVPGNMDKHLREVHDIKGNTEWLKHVQVIPGGTKSPSQLNQLMSLINTVVEK